jgi:hypothetical protein
MGECEERTSQPLNENARHGPGAFVNCMMLKMRSMRLPLRGWR